MRSAIFLYVLALGAQDPAIDEQKLKVPSVNEAEWPMPGDEAEILKQGYIPIPGGGYQFEKKQADNTLSTGAVVPGRIMMNQGMIELLGCGEGGKEHESVLRVDCDIQALDLALTLSHFKRGPVPKAINAADPAQGSRVVVLAQWKEGDKTVTRRAEDLVIRTHRGTTMPRVGWTYVASLVDVEDPAAPGKKKPQRVLAATGTRSFLTISWNSAIRESSTLFDNPLAEALDDTSYVANYTVLPAMGTPVKIILRSPTAAERDEIAKLEKDTK